MTDELIDATPEKRFEAPQGYRCIIYTPRGFRLSATIPERPEIGRTFGTRTKIKIIDVKDNGNHFEIRLDGELEPPPGTIVTPGGPRTPGGLILP